MTPFKLTPIQHRNLTMCIDEINQIDAEIELAKKCSVTVPDVLIQELENARQKVYDYLKNYQVKNQPAEKKQSRERKSNREVL